MEDPSELAPSKGDSELVWLEDSVDATASESSSVGDGLDSCDPDSMSVAADEESTGDKGEEEESMLPALGESVLGSDCPSVPAAVGSTSGATLDEETSISSGLLLEKVSEASSVGWGSDSSGRAVVAVGPLVPSDPSAGAIDAAVSGVTISGSAG